MKNNNSEKYEAITHIRSSHEWMEEFFIFFTNYNALFFYRSFSHLLVEAMNAIHSQSSRAY